MLLACCGCLLQDRDTLLRSLPGYGAPRCHFFNTFFLNKLFKDEKKYNYKNVSTHQRGEAQTAQMLLSVAGQVVLHGVLSAWRVMGQCALFLLAPTVCCSTSWVG